MRKSNIELLRIILAFLLVGWHYYFHTYGITWTFLVFAMPSAAIVPIFALITGYFLSKNQTYSFPLKFLITFIYVYLINLAVGSLIYGVSGGLNHAVLLKLCKLGGRDWWYLWALLIIYLIAPILNRGLTLISKNYFIFMIVLFTILFFILSYWIKFEYVSAMSAKASGLILLLYYYLIGAGFRLYLTDFTYRYRKLIYLVAPAILLLLMVVVMLLYVNHQDIQEFVYPAHLPVLVASITIFTLFHEINIKSSKVINYFASLGLVIYLFHYLFQYLMVKYIRNWSSIVEISYLINTLLTYAMSVVFAIPITFVLNNSVKWSWKQLNVLNQKLMKKARKGS